MACIRIVTKIVLVLLKLIYKYMLSVVHIYMTMACDNHRSFMINYVKHVCLQVDSKGKSKYESMNARMLQYDAQCSKAPLLLRRQKWKPSEKSETSIWLFKVIPVPLILKVHGKRLINHKTSLFKEKIKVLSKAHNFFCSSPTMSLPRWVIVGFLSPLFLGAFCRRVNKEREGG